MADDGNLLRRVHEIVAEAMDREVSDIGREQDLFEDLDLDSIGIVMIYVELSMVFGIPEPPSNVDLSRVRSVNDLTDYVTAELAAMGTLDAV